MYASLLLEDDDQSTDLGSFVTNTFLQGKTSQLSSKQQLNWILSNTIIDSIISGPSSPQAILNQIDQTYGNLKKYWKAIVVGAGLTLVAFLSIRKFLDRRIKIFEGKIANINKAYEKAVAPLRERLNTIYGLGAYAQKDRVNLLDLLRFKSPGDLKKHIYELAQSNELDPTTASNLLSTLREPKAVDELKELIQISSKVQKEADKRNINLMEEQKGLTRWLKYKKIWWWIAIFLMIYTFLSFFIKFFRRFFEQKKEENVTQEASMSKSPPSIVVLISNVWNSMSERITNFATWVENQSVGKQVMIAIGIAFICATIYFSIKLVISPQDFGSYVFEVWKNIMRKNIRGIFLFIGCACAAVVLYPIITYYLKMDIPKKLQGEDA